MLDHIWQCYVDNEGKPVQLSAQVYYSTLLNAICSFYDLEEYPINLAGIFQDHINPSLQKGFRSHYPNYGHSCLKAAITQQLILVKMMNALIKAKNNVMNIREIVCVEQLGGEQFHAQAHPSNAEKTLQKYSSDATPGDDRKHGGRPECFGCGKSHPWSKLVDGMYVVICPNAHMPGVKEKAELNIQKFQSREKKNARNNKQRRNLNMLNWEDIPKKRCEVIINQQCALISVTESSSVSSSLTGSTPGASFIRRSNITLLQDVIVLSTQSSKPQIPITIHSPMPHLSLQTVTAKEENDCRLSAACSTPAHLSALRTSTTGHSRSAVPSHPQGYLSP